MSLAIAVIAVALAIGSWFRPSSSANAEQTDPASAYSEQEIADATAALCEAHELTGRATQTAASRKSDDPAIMYIVATNVRLGATASAEYLLQKVADNPAAPTDLSDAIQRLAITYQQTTLLHLADAEDKELDEAYNLLDETDEKVGQACR